MRDAFDENGNPLPDEERLTSAGKMVRSASIDELLQLINVLKGDMSLVGPRPLLMQYLKRYSAEQARRHEVKPGITGWAQVNGRNAISWEEKFLLDVEYVDKQSFWLDLKILWMTFLNVFQRKGISADGHATMGSLRVQINKIDMSTPQLLAETDAKMIQELNTLGYFKYIFLTVFGKGFGDRIKKE